MAGDGRRPDASTPAETVSGGAYAAMVARPVKR